MTDTHTAGASQNDAPAHNISHQDRGHSMNREELIEEAAKAIYGATFGTVPAAFEPDAFEDWKAIASAALAVFEQAHIPTDDDREALSEFLFTVYEHGSQPNALREADAILSFLRARRTVQGEPTDAQVLTAYRAHIEARMGRTLHDAEFEATKSQVEITWLRAALRAAAEAS